MTSSSTRPVSSSASTPALVFCGLCHGAGILNSLLVQTAVLGRLALDLSRRLELSESSAEDVACSSMSGKENCAPAVLRSRFARAVVLQSSPCVFRVAVLVAMRVAMRVSRGRAGCHACCPRCCHGCAPPHSHGCCHLLSSAIGQVAISRSWCFDA